MTTQIPYNSYQINKRITHLTDSVQTTRLAIETLNSQLQELRSFTRPDPDDFELLFHAMQRHAIALEQELTKLFNSLPPTIQIDITAITTDLDSLTSMIEYQIQKLVPDGDDEEEDEE